MPRMAISRPTPRWCWPSRCGLKPRELADAHRGDAWRATRTSMPRRSPGPASSICGSSPPTGDGVLAVARSPPAPTTAGATLGRGGEGQRRVRLGQPDRADACRPLPRRGVRRRARHRCSTLAGYAVTREYYINDAGAQVDLLARSALPPLPRGARRDDRADPGRALSRATTSSRSAAALAEQYRRRRCIDLDESDWLPIVRDDRGRHDDGVDPRRSRRCSASGTTSSSPSGRCRSRRRRIASAEAIDWLAREGPHLPGRAAAAQGPAARGLGGSRADPVPLHRFRRRRRPAAHEVGRQLHLFRLRHRLSLRQVPARLPRHDRRARAPTTAATSSG